MDTPAEPIEVQAEEREQCGEKIYVAKCPGKHCGQEIALCGEGRIICSCGQHLRFVKKD